MKKLIVLLSLVLTFALTPLVHAIGFWQIDISTPATTLNTRSFNVQYTTLSTESADTIDVQLFQNEVNQGMQTTIKPYGDSGVFAVTVPSDGTYEYFLRADNDGDIKTTDKKTVTVDATAPAAPQYGVKTRDGNSYTVTFTAPADGDVQQIRIFSSTTTTFIANSATLAGTVAVTPGQSTSFTYNAGDATERLHAIQAVDSAGNASTLVGDPNVVATAATGEDLIALGDTAGVVQGATTGTSSANTGAGFNSGEGIDSGQVLGAAASSNNRTRNTIYAALIALVLLAATVVFTRRRADSE